MPRPVPGRATLRAQYFTSRPTVSSSDRHLMTDGTTRTTLSLRALPHRGADLQLLRPRPALLRGRLCAAGASPFSTQGRSALPSQCARSACPRRAAESLPCPTQQSDASGFPTTGDGCSTAGEPARACKSRIAVARALPFLPSAASGICAQGLSAPTGSPSPSNRSERTIP